MRLRGRKAGTQLWLGFSLDSGNNKKMWNCSKKGDIIITFVSLKLTLACSIENKPKKGKRVKYKD